MGWSRKRRRMRRRRTPKIEATSQSANHPSTPDLWAQKGTLKAHLSGASMSRIFTTDALGRRYTTLELLRTRYRPNGAHNWTSSIVSATSWRTTGKTPCLPDFPQQQWHDRTTELQSAPQLTIERWCRILGRALVKFFEGRDPKPPPNYLPDDRQKIQC